MDVDVRDMETEEGGWDVTDVCQVTVKCESGYFDVTYRTEHNGYYGGSLEYAGEHAALPEGATRITKDGMPT